MIDPDELQSRLEVIHEQIKGRMRDYRNGRTKNRYYERSKGVRLAMDELQKLRMEAAEKPDLPKMEAGSGHNFDRGCGAEDYASDVRAFRFGFRA